jgi:hypothetical protein
LAVRLAAFLAKVSTSFCNRSTCAFNSAVSSLERGT